MSLLALGQLAGISFAAGLNLYATVAILGILARLGFLPGLPPGLQGLGGGIVIGSAVALFVVEAIIDKVHHVDSVWDCLHTFIRPPAAALLAIGALWGQPEVTIGGGAALAFLIALAAHGTKAGLRMALNATMTTGWHTWISVGEDVLAAALAVLAFVLPVPTLIAVGVAIFLTAVVGPRLWRAFHLGGRGIAAWLRSIFNPSGWVEAEDLPGSVRRAIGDPPMGAAPPRGARAAITGAPGIGAFRNGWLAHTSRGTVFVHRTLFGTRRVDLPEPSRIRAVPGVWATLLHVEADEDRGYTLFLLKDGPDAEVAIRQLTP